MYFPLFSWDVEETLGVEHFWAAARTNRPRWCRFPRNVFEYGNILSHYTITYLALFENRVSENSIYLSHHWVLFHVHFHCGYYMIYTCSENDQISFLWIWVSFVKPTNLLLIWKKSDLSRWAWHLEWPSGAMAGALPEGAKFLTRPQRHVPKMSRRSRQHWKEFQSISEKMLNFKTIFQTFSGISSFDLEVVLRVES